MLPARRLTARASLTVTAVPYMHGAFRIGASALMSGFKSRILHQFLGDSLNWQSNERCTATYRHLI